MAVRLVLAGFAYLMTLGLAYGLLIPAVPPDPTASESFVSPAVAPFVMTAVHTAVMGWLILRARRRGWGLVAVMIAVFFGVQTLMPQVESWLFQATSGMAAHLPSEMIPRIVLAGLLHACLWIPLAVWILGRGGSAGTADSGPRSSLTASLKGWKLPVAAVAYVLVYFLFGYYVAWRSPAVRAYYGGTDPGTFWVQFLGVLRDTPWLPLAQLVRGAVWTWIGVAVLRSMRGGLLEKALAVGALFGFVMTAGLLLPNPYMPYAVRMAHLVETASSNFLFGVFVAGLFGQGDRDMG
ncbi:MAG TPA: hypothetical protein VFE68_12750 [Vicinamibacteria bacterium]|nr:hypothetical protein [Vicinamibacteria bacterium]